MGTVNTVNQPMTAVRGRPVTLSREGAVYRLAFAYNPDLVSRAKDLPFSAFDGQTRSWTAAVCAQTIQALRRMWHEGLLDVGPDELLYTDEAVPEAREAVLRAGTNKRPYYVHFATRGSAKFAAFRAIPGGMWEKKAGALSYPPASAAALADMVDRGVLDDPDTLLATAGVTVSFDGRTGRFAVRGDGRAVGVFHTYFPARDVMAEWKTKGIDVDFLDDYTAMMYRGELARVGDGFQPDGLKLDLMPYQKQAVALALARTGLGVYLEPGLGKCLHPDTPIWVNGRHVPIGKLFDEQATAPWSDGEGEWATPKDELTVHALDPNNRATNMAVTRLYRQRVSENLLKVTLEDGSTVTVTKAHKLLVDHGDWTTDFAVGSRVAVPSRVEWAGQDCNLDAVKLLAEQVGDGHTEVPDFVMQGSAEVVRTFLSHYFAAAGHVSPDGRVELSTTSETLLRQVQYLLRRFGIGMALARHGHAAAAGTHRQEPCWTGSVPPTSALGFNEHVGVIDAHAQARLDELGLRLKAEPATDSAPQGGGDDLHKIPDTDVWWARIVSVDEVPYGGYVYDLEVTGPHNFVAGGIYCHNTAIGIATGLELTARDQTTRTVVVVPSGVRTQWANEIVKFTPADAADIVVIRGDRKRRAAAYEAAKGAKWVIVHYDVLSRDEDDLKPLFAGAFVIADEAHRVKNHRAARTAALHNLARGARRRMALTGTPVETHPGEWFEVLSGFAVPGCLGSPFEFNERYRWKANFGGYEGARNLPELRERSRPFYIRFTKAQVAKYLPPLRVQTIALDPSASYEAALRRAHHDAVEEIRNANLARAGKGRPGANSPQFALIDSALADEDVEDGAAMTAVGQLRLLCSSPRLINSDSLAGKALIDAGIIPDEDGPKVDEVRTVCAELLAAQQRRHADFDEAGRAYDSAMPEEVTGERIVLFTFSKRMAHLLAERLTEDGVPHVMYTGDTSMDARDEATAAFTDPTSDVVAFIATDAAAEGLNLGACCSTLINVDLPWTPTRLAQRSQRIHRMDGKAPHYQVTNLIVAGTMEHGILKLLEARSDMADALFGERGARRNTLGARVSTRSGSFATQALEAYAGTSPARKPRARGARQSAAGADQRPPAPRDEDMPPDDDELPPPPDDDYPPPAPAPAPARVRHTQADGTPSPTPPEVDGQLLLL